MTLDEALARLRRRDDTAATVTTDDKKLQFYFDKQPLRCNINSDGERVIHFPEGQAIIYSRLYGASLWGYDGSSIVKLDYMPVRPIRAQIEELWRKAQP